MQTLYDRYLIIDKTGAKPRRLETPQFFLMRVAMGLFLNEKSRERVACDYYRIMAERRFSPSTPTLFNSMTLHSQLSSCYLYKVDDSLDSIFERGISDNARLSKWAGGLGGSWTAVRGTGAYIGGTNGESQGVIPFLKIHNDQLVAVNQGGKRKGSGCAYLETWHNDILEFLELRKNVGDDRRRTHDMNTANWVPDLFMKRMEARQKWTLFRANEVADLHETYGQAFEAKYVAYEKLAEEGKIYGQTIEAIDLWKKMLSMLFETGHPWITFKDPCNVRSPQDHAGVIHSSNLCSEICLNTSKEETAVCNLGSVLICNHLKADGSLDLPKLRETIRLAMRALDNVIDLNFYPTESARTANMRHRPVGLGVMGLAEALYLKNLPFASIGAVEFSDEFMEAIAYYTYEASSDLAAERGTYASYKGSKWSRGIFPQDTIDLLEKERGLPINVPRSGKMDWSSVRAKVAAQGMRNSNCLAIAPTATISNITGCSPCIEPTFKNLFVKSNLSGDFTVLNPFLVRDLKARSLWTKEIADALKYNDGELGGIAAIPADLKEKYLTAFDIGYQWVIDAAARRSKWIDQSQSLNFWLKTPDLKSLSHLYRALFHSGAKTSYYMRSTSASNIEKATVAVKKELRGVVGHVPVAVMVETAPPAILPPKKEYSAEEKLACSIEARREGGTCEACS
jgi:ribonucleoside-diphosphate reductase alpha chain